MKRSSTIIALAATTVMWAGAAKAFDGDRKGFVLEIGTGPGFQSSSQESSVFGETLEVDASGTAFGTNFKIGYGFTNRFIVTWTSNANWGSGESILSGEDKLCSTASVELA